MTEDRKPPARRGAPRKDPSKKGVSLCVVFEPDQAAWLRQQPNISETLRRLVSQAMASEK